LVYPLACLGQKCRIRRGEVGQDSAKGKRVAIAVGVPFLTFISGIVVQLIFSDFSSKILTTADRVIICVLAAMLIVLVGLVLLLASENRERYQVRSEINARLEEISKKFGISVEFTPDNDGLTQGLTYLRTKELIERARKSLVFVDFWVATGDYLKDKPQAKDNRDLYYETILARIRAQPLRTDGEIFHRRIVQMPELAVDGSRFTLTADKRFASYLTSCLELQAEGQGRSLVKVAKPYVHAHFTIIDQRYVVLPILTSDPRKGGLRRHGALIFDDIQGNYVNQLMAIYSMIDAVASPLEEEHLQ
jgi:hypothetical protein